MHGALSLLTIAVALTGSVVVVDGEGEVAPGLQVGAGTTPLGRVTPLVLTARVSRLTGNPVQCVVLWFLLHQTPTQHTHTHTHTHKNTFHFHVAAPVLLLFPFWYRGKDHTLHFLSMKE